MKTGLAVAVLLGWLLAGSPAAAGLGQQAASVRVDQAAMRGTLVSVSHPGYSVQQITSQGGIVVREYVATSGQIFGVAWQGPTMPNLSQLLGSYFSQFQAAARSSGRRRGPVVIHTDQLVIESGGHMRSFHGRAYLPGLLPYTLTQAVVR